MKAVALIAVMLATGLISISSGHAQQLRYWGQSPGAAKGWIEFGPGKYYEIAPGVEIPGWGRVKAVSDSRLIVEQVLIEEQKERLRDQGAMVYDVLEIHIPHEDLRYPKPMTPASSRH